MIFPCHVFVKNQQKKHWNLCSAKALSGMQWFTYTCSTNPAGASVWQKTGVRESSTFSAPPLPSSSLSHSLSDSFLPTWPDMSSTLVPLQQHSAWPSHCLILWCFTPFHWVMYRSCNYSHQISKCEGLPSKVRGRMHHYCLFPSLLSLDGGFTQLIYWNK